MIRALLLSSQGEKHNGGQELIANWHERGGKLWLDLDGLPESELRPLLLSLGCDELSIRDALRKRHPPKLEHFPDYSFILFRGIAQLDDTLELSGQQLGIWIGRDILITARRGHSVSIEHYWQSEHVAGLLANPNLLGLAILEYASGRYLECLLGFESKLEDLEDSILTAKSESGMRELVVYRGRLRKLRRVFSYHQRMAEDIWKNGSEFLGNTDDDTLPHRRNLYDRCERLYSLCAMYYEISGDLVEGYISLSSHRLNNTMKVLTIITAIFVPLSFLAGIYGMNFEHMPELGWKYAYFVLLGAMATIATTMLILFKKIRWL